MFWTKPHAGYYRQILAMTGRRPDQCLMVGDDPRMDMAAKEAGIATWLAVGRRGRAAGSASRRSPGNARSAHVLAAGNLSVPRYFRSHAPSRRISLLFPPGNSAVSEALKTT